MDCQYVRLAEFEQSLGLANANAPMIMLIRMTAMLKQLLCSLIAMCAAAIAVVACTVVAGLLTTVASGWMRNKWPVREDMENKVWSGRAEGSLLQCCFSGASPAQQTHAHWHKHVHTHT